MPYLKKEDQHNGLQPEMAITTPGELNYSLTQACLNYLRQGPVCYERLNAVIGALESAKLEMYRRVVVPYEETKLKENGDVY